MSTTSPPRMVTRCIPCYRGYHRQCAGQTWIRRAMGDHLEAVACDCPCRS